MDRPRQSDGRVHGVIVGCRRQDGRWLLIRRGRDIPAAPLRVCFPGGAIEPGETQAQAAVREMREELGAQVELVRCVWRFEFDDKPLTLWGWLGRLVSDVLTPDPHEVAQILWLEAHEAAAHADCLPHTDQFIAALIAAGQPEPQ